MERESAKLELLGPQTQGSVVVAVNLVNCEPPKKLDGVTDLLPNNHSTGEMP